MKIVFGIVLHAVFKLKSNIFMMMKEGQFDYFLVG